MNWAETIRMAIHNLWARKRRTILNMIGIVTACTMLLMTFAGTRGVAEGIQAMLSQSEEFRTILVSPERGNDETPPFTIDDIEGEMSEDRRERIFKQLEQNWSWSFGFSSPLELRDFEEIGKLKNVVEMIPQSSVYCRYEFLDQSDLPKSSLSKEVRKALGESNEGTTTPISLLGSLVKKRIVFGEMIQPNDRNGVLISEAAAYRLGFCDDAQLKSLIGRKLELQYQPYRNRTSFMLSLLNTDVMDGDLLEKAELMGAVKRLVEEMDQTELSTREKEVIRNALSGFSADEPTDPESRFLAANELEQPVQVNFSVVIRGVMKHESDTGLLASLGNYFYEDADIEIHPELAVEICSALPQESQFYSMVIKISDVELLRETVDEIESLGYTTNSAVDVIRNVKVSIDKIKQGISILALLIMAITAMTVFNAMVISVMERTAEFGIMKAVGASNINVLRLMLCEGAMTGLLGAIVAVGVSMSLTWVVGLIVRRYVESEINGVFDQSIFSFSLLDIALISALATLVCVLASIIPAWRASKLDPIVAMQAK